MLDTRDYIRYIDPSTKETMKIVYSNYTDTHNDHSDISPHTDSYHSNKTTGKNEFHSDSIHSNKTYYDPHSNTHTDKSPYVIATEMNIEIALT